MAQNQTGSDADWQWMTWFTGYRTIEEHKSPDLVLGIMNSH